MTVTSGNQNTDEILFAFCRSFGLMNGITFSRDTVLTKNDHQTLNVSLYVNTYFDDLLHPLTVDRLDAETVNGHRIWRDQMDDTVLVTQRVRPDSPVASPVAFEEQLVVENLIVEGETLFGARMQEIQQNMELRRLLEERGRGFKDLIRVVQKATRAPGKSSRSVAAGGGSRRC